MNLNLLFAVALCFFMSQFCFAEESADCSKFPIEIKQSHQGSTIATDQQVRLTISAAQTSCIKKTITGIRDYQNLFKCPDDSTLISSTPVESINGEKRGQVQLSVYCKSSQSVGHSRKNTPVVDKKSESVSIPANGTTPSSSQANPATR